MLVKIEIWMSMGDLLGKDFYSPSDLRSEITVDVEDRMSVKTLFSQLAVRYPPIAGKIFDLSKAEFLPDVLVTYNDQVISLDDLYEKVLETGDNIRILPIHTGG